MTEFTANARCTTTDDGTYDCRFQEIANGHGFELSAPGKPTIRLIGDDDGPAMLGYLEFANGKGIPLPGTYYAQEGATVYVNEETGATVRFEMIKAR